MRATTGCAVLPERVGFAGKAGIRSSDGSWVSIEGARGTAAVAAATNATVLAKNNSRGEINERERSVKGP